MVRFVIRLLAAAVLSVAIALVVVGIPAVVDSGWAWVASGLLVIAATALLFSAHHRHKTAVANGAVAHLFISRQWGPASGDQPTLADVVEQSAADRRPRRAAAVLCEIVGTPHSGRVLRDRDREAVWDVVRGIDFDPTQLSDAKPTDVVGAAVVTGWRSVPRTRPASLISDGVRTAAITAHLTGQYRTAATMYGRMWAMSRDWSDAYGAACAHARIGAPDEAMTWLTRAGRGAWIAGRHVHADDDLQCLRHRPDFAPAAAAFPRWTWRARTFAWSERVVGVLFG